MKWILITLALFFASCSDPVSSADLEAQEIKFVGSIVSKWDGYNSYQINVKLNPQDDDYDYVVLTKVDSFFIQIDSTKKKLTFSGSSYSTDFEFQQGQKLEVILYLGTSHQRLVSTIDIPPVIHSTALDVNIEGQAKYHWLTDLSDQFNVNWLLKCANDSTSQSTSFNQNLRETIGIAEWDIYSFIKQSKWNTNTTCNLKAKATRTIKGEIDFNYAGGEFNSSQIDERNYTFGSP